MRKGSEENKNQQNKDSVTSSQSNPWAIGTKTQQKPSGNQQYYDKQGTTKEYKEGGKAYQQPYNQKKYNSNQFDQQNSGQHQHQNYQGEKYSNQGQQNQQQQQHRHIPKLKERNPFSVIKSFEQEFKSEKVLPEIKGLLSTLNPQSYNVSEVMSEIIKLFDSHGISNFEIIEFVLSQTKTKDYFREFTAQQSQNLINTLVSSMNNNKTYQNKDSNIKLLGHLLYEQNDIDNTSIQKIYTSIQKLCFDNPQSNTAQQQQQQTTGGSGSSQNQSQHKTQRLAMNCLANLLLRQSPFLKENYETIFLKLKSIFEYHMRKIQQNFKSKRFISMLTTIIRALQLSMSENPKLSQLNDTECIKLYINFYKLLFLGTPFAEKMLNIKLEEQKSKSSKTVGKGSQVNSITQNNWDDNEDEEVKGDSGSFIIDTSDLSSSDSGFNDDSSIKGGNKKSPSSNDSITSSDPYQKIKNHAALCLQILLKQKNKALFNYWYLLFPSFFLRSPTEYTPYLQQSEYQKRKPEFFQKLTLNINREPSLFYILKSKDNSVKLKQTICFIINILLENSILSKWQDTLETEDQYKQQLQQTSFVSISSCLGQFLRYLHYQLIFMIENEKDTRMIQSYVKSVGALLQTTPYQKMNPNLASLLIEELRKLNQLCIQSQHSEIDQILRQQVLSSLTLAINNQELRKEVNATLLQDQQFLKQLIKVDKKSDFNQYKDQVELFNLVQKVCKNFPGKMLDIYNPHFHDFLAFYLKSYDRKRISNTVNIIEEWLKNYKSDQVNIDEDGVNDELTLEESKDDLQMASQNTTPYNIESFKVQIRDIVNNLLLSKQNQYSDVNISILSLLCNLDQTQWKLVFDDEMTQDIIDFVQNAKYPPLLKAASIKLLGYLVYFDSLFQDFHFKTEAYQLIFDNANDTNQNVQIRNSWALANMCCLDVSIQDDYILREILISSINYSLSNKEKVSANGIRALGYFLKNIDEQVISQKILTDINKSPQLLQRIGSNIGLKQGSQPLTLETILMVVISNLDNKSPKISWNSSVALSNLLDNKSFSNINKLYSKQTINPLLNALLSRPNFKTKIHASQTLQKFVNVSALQDKQLTLKFWETMLNSIEYINTVNPYQNDVKYIQQLEWNVITLWEQLAQLSMNQEDTQNLQEIRNYIAIVGEFINLNALALLHIITDYIRKELKIPQYSGMYDEDIIKSETDALFHDNPLLESKLEKLRTVIQAIREIIKNTEEVHVSFGVFESINSLADAKVRDYRLLDTLKGVKSSFNPASFEMSKSQGDDSGESDKS